LITGIISTIVNRVLIRRLTAIDTDSNRSVILSMVDSMSEVAKSAQEGSSSMAWALYMQLLASIISILQTPESTPSMWKRPPQSPLPAITVPQSAVTLYGCTPPVGVIQITPSAPPVVVGLTWSSTFVGVYHGNIIVAGR